MIPTTQLRDQLGRGLILWTSITLIIGLSTTTNYRLVNANSGVIYSSGMSENELWSKYRPLAVDESHSSLPEGRLPPPYSDPEAWYNPMFDPEGAITSRPVIPDLDSRTNNLGVIFGDPTRKPTVSPKSSLLTDITGSWSNSEVNNLLFKLPDKDKKGEVTQLITDSSHSPTFFDEKLRMPDTKVKYIDNVKTKGKERVLASYKILVPIFLPAMKSKRKPTLKPPQVKFAKEQVTEMVPIKNMIPVVKEVIKAEPVPQKVVIDYVQSKNKDTMGKVRSAAIDDRIEPDEKVVMTQVMNVD